MNEKIGQKKRDHPIQLNGNRTERKIQVWEKEEKREKKEKGWKMKQNERRESGTDGVNLSMNL